MQIWNKLISRGKQLRKGRIRKNQSCTHPKKGKCDGNYHIPVNSDTEC
jgi:hypothetical protein